MSGVILISDFNVLGSGYKTIVVGIGNYLCEQGIEVKLLGANDQGREHNYPFSIIPIRGTSSVDEIWGYLKNMWAEFKYSDVLVLADMPIVNNIVERCHDLDTSFSGLFPLESTPLSPSWALRLMSLKHAFLMSQFGYMELERCNVPSTFIPVPISSRMWYPASDSEKRDLRGSTGIDKFTFLTVAENQERKNLSCAADIISKLEGVQWILVTRTKAQWGWNINDLLRYYNISDRTLVIEKGMPDSALRQLYQASDALLVTSKAEGLALPVLEAMACKLLVVAPRHTALAEHLSNGRGILFESEYQYLDPFGNQIRYFASVEGGVEACKFAMDGECASMVERAYEYVSGRSWDHVGEVICQKLGL